MRVLTTAITTSFLITLSAGGGAQVPPQAPPISVVKEHAEGPVNYKSIPGGPVGVYFTVQNTGRAVVGDLRADIYFCKASSPESCYRSSLHTEKIGELLPPGRNRRSAVALKIDVKLPLEAQVGTRWVRVHVTNASGAPDASAMTSFQVVAPACVKYYPPKGKKRKCVEWTNPG